MINARRPAQEPPTPVSRSIPTPRDYSKFQKTSGRFLGHDGQTASIEAADGQKQSVAHYHHDPSVLSHMVGKPIEAKTHRARGSSTIEFPDDMV